MKKFKTITLLLVFLTSISLFSQELDKIYLKNKEVVSGKILQVTSENIEINPKGSKPFLIIKRDEVKLIIYSDNTIVSFDDSDIKDEKIVEDNLKNREEIKLENLGESDILMDERDSQKYKIGKIGSQIWMFENINYKTKNSFMYNNTESYRDKYGLLYVWEDALDVCPDGWHLPSRDEILVLVSFFGSKKTAAKALKNANDWKINKGTNSSGFNALPGGMGNYNGSFYDGFNSIGRRGYFWTSDQSIQREHSAYSFSFDGNAMYPKSERIKSQAFSCRCIKN